MKRKILLISTIISIMLLNTVYATTQIPEESTEIVETFVEEQALEVPEASQTEAQTNIETEPPSETSQEYPIITLNFDVEFLFDAEDFPIYMIQVKIPTGLEDRDGGEYVEYINILKKDNFTTSKNITVYSEGLTLTANVDGDNAFLYNIDFDGYEDIKIGNEIVRNTTEINNITNGAIYNVHLIVSENENAIIKDPNDINETDPFIEDVISGEYGESRAAEIESSLAEETQPSVEPVEENNTISVVVITVVIVLIILIAAGIIYIKRLQKDDDE